MKYLILVLVFLLPQEQLLAQSYQKQKNQLFVYNVAIGGIIGGVGALINKGKDENGWKVFLKGTGQGLLGGFINYQAKNLTYQIAKKEKLSYGWWARITQSVAASITENAASNRNFWESFHINYGPIRFEIDKRNAFKPSVKVAPGALYGMIWMSTKGRFDFKTSFQSGAPVFLSDGSIRIFGDLFAGYVLAGSMAYDKRELDNYELFAHEFIHVLQYDDYVGLNSFFDKPLQKWIEKTSFFRATNKFIYYDFHLPIWSTVLLIVKEDFDTYYRNWFEFEAEHFATKRAVVR
ncbi:MAG: hypothetical protein AAF990_04525 [Bacteroidota bacterium]